MKKIFFLSLCTAIILLEVVFLRPGISDESTSSIPTSSSTTTILDTSAPEPPRIIGVTEGSLYKSFTYAGAARSVKPTWYDAAGTVSTATVSKNGGNPQPHTKGFFQDFADTGTYELVVKATKTSNGLTAETSVSFTINAAALEDVFITNAELGGTALAIQYVKNTYYGSRYPVFALWAEDSGGNFLHNLYVSGVPATNIMRFTNTLANRPQLLPYWSHKACEGKSYGSTFLYLSQPEIPVPSNLDAVTGATPSGDFIVQTQAEPASENSVKIVFEINIPYDWGWYFTADKYSDTYYAANGEPSLVYAADIDLLSSPGTEYALHCIGYGHYAGGDGLLYTDFEFNNTFIFDYAADMVESIIIRIGDDPTDADTDGTIDVADNCPTMCNSLQSDADSDGTGDVCDTAPGCGGCGQAACEVNCDIDIDAILNDADNCPAVYNVQQLDADSDGTGDVCDTAPGCGGCGQAACEAA
ncbi:MAG: thrombospondin type 3 repeat-containing protein [Deltaproteobacteria bacterium]|nr:thrombospondin type 3 repeat-containing protein [Deltaproteobacteria bacterium]